MNKLQTELTPLEKAIVALKNWSYLHLWDIYVVSFPTQWPGGLFTTWSNVRTPDGRRRVAFHIEEIEGKYQITPFIMRRNYGQN